MDEMYFGVYDQLLYARKTEPVQGSNLPFTSSYPSTAACILLRKHTYAIYHSLAHWPVLTNRNHIHLECCILFPTLSWYTRQTFVRQNCTLATYVLYPLTYMCLATGAQWTGIVTSIAVEMLKANMVDAVVCVQRHPNKIQMPHNSFSVQCTSITTWIQIMFFIPSAVILTTGLLQGRFWPGIVKLMAFRIFLYGLCITLLDWMYICSSRLSVTILSLNFCY